MKRPFTEIYKSLYKDSSTLAKKDKAPKEKKAKPTKSLNMARSEKTMKKSETHFKRNKTAFQTLDGTEPHNKNSRSITRASDSAQQT